MGPYARSTLMQNGYASMIIPTAGTTYNEDPSVSLSIHLCFGLSRVQTYRI